MLTLSTIFNVRFCNCSDSVIICVSFYYNVQCLKVRFSKYNFLLVVFFQLFKRFHNVTIASLLLGYSNLIWFARDF